MKTLKGPGIFLAQFIGPEAPFNSLDAIAEWAAGLGYVGVQMPTGDATSFFDLALAAESQTYCDEIAGVAIGLRSGQGRHEQPAIPGRDLDALVAEPGGPAANGIE
eukprot:gene2401-biopygen2043